MLSQVIVILAGLGLFFYGMDMLSRSLKDLAGRRIQAALAAAARSRFRSLLVGALGGALTQSSAGISFIVVSLLSAGLVTTSGALQIVIGAGIGTSVLPLLISFDLAGAALAMIGISGVALTSSPLRPYAAFFKAGLGFAFTFYGLALIKQGAAAITLMPGFAPLMLSFAGADLAVFAGGFVLACALQAPVAVMILAISLHSQAVLTLEQAAVIIYGALLAIGPILYLLSSNVRGIARRVPVFQIGFSAFSAALGLVCFVLEVRFGVPLLFAALRALHLAPGQQAGLIPMIVIAATSALAIASLGWISEWLARRYPETRSDAFSRPRYLQDVALDEPGLALLLVEKEQTRLLEGFADIFDAHRAGQRAQIRQISEVGQRLGDQIDDYLRTLCRQELPAGLYEGVQRALARQSELMGLFKDIEALLAETDGIKDTALTGIAAAMVEGLDAKRMVVLDAMTTREADDIGLAVSVTSPARGILDDIRRRYLDLETTALDAGQRLGLLRLLGRYERTDCRLHSLASTLRPAGAADLPPDTAPVPPAATTVPSA